MFDSRLWQLFAAPADASMLAYGQYDPYLVTLSVLVAIFASWMGLQMAGLANDRRVPRLIVLLSGSLALGSGVWAMHFIGMLAFNLCTRVEYDPLITLASGLPSVGASFVALNLIGREQLSRWQLLAGGVLVGAGIGAMHYAGMAAMRTSLTLHYDPLIFGLSIVVAVVLATLALWVRFGLRGWTARLGNGASLLASATVMGCAIAGMHYTGMAAARFIGVADQAAAETANASFLALAIGLITVAFTALVVAVNGLLRYRSIFMELRQTEDWTREMLTTTEDGVITVRGDGVIEAFNLSAERIFRWRAEEVIGKHIALLIAEPERDRLLDVLRGGRPALGQKTSEVLALRSDGSTVPVRRTLGHARLGRHDRFVCFVTDISERRAMEQALRDSERQFRSLIGNLPGISYRSLAQECRPMVFVSDAVERITGYPAAAFTGVDAARTFDALIEPHDRARVAGAVAIALQERQPYLVEYALRHADGSLRWLWENGTPVADDQGSMCWLDGVILDMTERRAMEEALREAKEKAEQAAAARASFVANMSHEIRTPMNSILGFTDLLLDSPLTPDQRHQLDTVRNAGRNLLRLLNEILDTAKLDKGAVELEIGDFNLLTLMEELASAAGAAAYAKALQLEVRCDPALPAWIRGDELRVRQVLANLLDNAMKFTERGSVTLAAHAHDGQLCFTVQDTGIGIAPERLQAIFDPFTQADASMTRRFGGTGLGTTIARQLVELMGGTIRVESTPGAGTAFHIRLPLVPGRAVQTRNATGGAAELPPLSILAADDVPQNLELLSLLATRRGHRVASVADGRAAVELARSGAFDLILMDMQMPVLDGLDATRAIRTAEQQDGRARVPVIAMTASVLPEHRRASAAAGMDGFATKPVDWAMLSHEIARVLGTQEPGTPHVPGQAAGELAVLDYRAGLDRWGEADGIYRQALQRFARDHAGTAAAIHACAAAGDSGAVRDHAHRARGVAANLALHALSARLAAIEAGADASGLEHDFAAAFDAIHALAPQAPVPATPGTPADRARVRAAAARLAEALAHGAMDDNALADLNAALAHGGCAPQLRQLRETLDDFDFDGAAVQLRAVADCIEAAAAGDDTP